MSMKMRAVCKDDCDLLYRWTNDPSVRRNSINTNPIPYQDHVEWFNKKLASQTSRIYICCDDGTPVAQIRIETDGDTGVVNYSVDSECRGRGIGTWLLRKVARLAKSDFPQLARLKGIVKYENEASKRAFEKAGYKGFDNGEYMEYELSTAME